jgi:c-di-GMP-binding flagellar brake protein YcgR
MWAKPWIGILWLGLLAGAGCVCFGLAHSLHRYLRWKHTRAAFTGEVVLGDPIWQVGQNLMLAPAETGLPSASASELPAQLQEIGRKTLLLRQEADPLAREFMRQVASGWPPVGAEITVTVQDADALYRFPGRVRDVRAEHPNSRTRLITLTRPMWLARLQRREHVRIALYLPALIYPGQRQDRPPLHATLRDLSGGGFRAELSGPFGSSEAEQLLRALSEGAVLCVRLPLPVLPDPLPARVRLAERTVVRGGLGVRVACTFLPLTAWEQEALIHHLFRIQQEQARSRDKRPGLLLR